MRGGIGSYLHATPNDPGEVRNGQMLPNLAQEKCLEFIEDCISEIGPCGEISGSEALDALRISCGYEALPTSSALGSFSPEKVSLPAGEVQPVELACAWGSNGQMVVEEFIHEQVLSRDEALSRLAAAGVERCYSDPALRQPKNYVPFVQRLHRLGLVDFSLEEAVEQVDFFREEEAGQAQDDTGLP